MSASTPAPENSPADDVAALPVAHRTLLTIAVMGASIIQMLDSTIANVAIPHMQTSLGATMDSVTWVLTSYILVSAVAMPAVGWLSDRVGSRRLFILSVGGFILASMLCGAATSLTQMVMFRMFQGICAAMIGPMSQTILLDINPPSRATKAMSYWAMGIMAAPIFGPMIGGWLTENYNWRWVFYINLPIGIPTMVVLIWLLPSRPKAPRKLDLTGFFLLALGLAALQLMLDRGQHEDWFQSWEIIIEACVAVAMFWMFAVHMLTVKEPIFPRTLTGSRNFMVALLFMMMMGLMMFGVFALLPPLLQNFYGYSVFDTGLLLAPRGLGILVAMFLVTRLTPRFDPRIFVALGFLLVALTMYVMTGWTLSMPASSIVLNGFFQGVGMGMTFMPMNVIAFSTLGMADRTDGSSLLYLCRSLGGSIGISLTTTLLARNLQINHEEIGARITSYSLPSVDLSSLDRFGAVGSAATRMVDLEVNRQAAMIAYLDDFHFMMIAVLVAIPLILLFRLPKGGLGTPPALME